MWGLGHWHQPAIALESPLNWSRSDPQPPLLETPAPSPPLLPLPASVGHVAPKAAIASPPRTAVEVLIDSVAAELQLDARLLHAMIYVESRYNADALSSKGAVGLMQVLPDTGKRFGYTDLHHPPTNIRAGATYLKWLMNHFDHNLELALAGYNAGEGAVKKYNRSIPPYPETQNYVHQVMLRYRDDPKARTVVHPTGWTLSPLKSRPSSQTTLAPLSHLFDLLLSTPSALAGDN
jgi:lysozyme